MQDRNNDTERERVFEEAEIVNDRNASFRSSTQDAFRDFAVHNASDMRKRLLWTAFWPLVTGLLVLFVFVALVVTILFWLLPFAAAAIIVALIIIFFGSAIKNVIGLFKK